MADLSDVETAMLAYISTALARLPLATNEGALVATAEGLSLASDDGSSYVPGTAVATGDFGNLTMYRGWPTLVDLNQDVSTGTSHVTVQVMPAMGRNATRYIGRPGILTTQPPTTLSLAVSGSDVTVSGVPAAGQVCGVLAGLPGTGRAYAYRVTADDTPTTIAAALVSDVLHGISNGPVATFPTSELVVRIGQDAAVLTEVRRQMAVFAVHVFAPTPVVRDKISLTLDAAFADLRFIPMPDGSMAHIEYQASPMFDAAARAEVWRRDIRYQVEYATTVTQSYPEMLFGSAALNGAPSFNA